MPSTRKRIGYLPSVNIHEIIAKIANKEKLSQSKVVGSLVEEALTARGLFDRQNTNNLISNSKYRYETKKKNNSYYNFSELDELISDKGISYNTKQYKSKSNDIVSESREAYDEELFEQFKQFIQFQKMIGEK
tara:strand:- start:127 stop:525 length:399 start_codon:yes stop_codon:yes gene_type:complete